MLPQPNFGPEKRPSREPLTPPDGDPTVPPRKLKRLRITMWIQIVCAVLAGYVYGYNAMSARAVSEETIRSYYVDNPPVEGDPVEIAKAAYETFQSTEFIVASLVIAGFSVLGAIVAALCTVRFKTGLKAVRWWAVGATAILFIVGMYMSTQFGLLVAPWVFASVLSLWWLFAADVRYWFSESAATADASGEDDAKGTGESDD